MQYLLNLHGMVGVIVGSRVASEIAVVPGREVPMPEDETVEVGLKLREQ